MKIFALDLGDSNKASKHEHFWYQLGSFGHRLLALFASSRVSQKTYPRTNDIHLFCLYYSKHTPPTFQPYHQNTQSRLLETTVSCCTTEKRAWFACWTERYNTTDISPLSCYRGALINSSNA